VASLSKKINKQLFLVFKKLMREFEAKSIQKILKDVIEAYTKNKADDISLNLTELEPYYADLYQAVEIIALKPLKVYGKNCNESWKQRKCHEVVTKRLGRGNLDHDFALSIYYWFHVFEDEIWGKRIDEQIVQETPDKPDLQKQLEVIVSQIKTNGLVDQIEDENKSDDIDFDDWEIDEFLDSRNPIGIPFFGREEELEALNNFAKVDKNFLFWAVIGPSGSGKTRLINSWKQALYKNGQTSAIKNWELLPIRAKDKKIQWSDWEPKKNTLIVIDYVYGYEETLKAIIKRGQEARGFKSNLKVRLILIDHVFPDKIGGFSDWKRWGLDQIHENDLKQSSLEKLFYNGKGGEPLRLSELSPNQDKIIRDILTHLAGEDTPQNTIEEALRYLKMLSKGKDEDKNKPGKAWTPLFAALVGHSLRHKQDYRATDRRKLIEYYLKGYQKLPWHRTPSTENFAKGQFRLEGAVAGVWIAAATARRGIRNEFLDIELVNRELNQIIDVEEVAVISEGVIASNKQNELLPFEPDLLGETFFLRFLDDLYCHKSNLRIFKTSFYKTFTNGFNKQDAIEFIAFIQRLVRNLHYDDQGSEETKHYWELLLKFLNPEHFSKGSITRWAISAALVNVIEVIRYIGGIDLLNGFNMAKWLAHVEEDALYELQSESIVFNINLPFAILYYDYVKDPELDLTKALIKLAKRYDQSLTRPSRMTALMHSCLMGVISVTNALLMDLGFDINACDEKNRTALMYAVSVGNSKIVGILLKREDLDVNAKDKEHRTALMTATTIGHLETVKCLLVRSDLEVNAKDKDNRTALMWTNSLYGDPSERHLITNALLERENLDVNAQDQKNRTALMWAITAGCYDILNALLSNTAVKINLQDSAGWTALILASYKGDIRIVNELLMREDLEINTQDNEKCTALMWASNLGHKQVVDSLLLNENLKINIQDAYHWTALIHASNHGRSDIVALLLTKPDIDINLRDNKLCSALMWASHNNRVEVVRILLAQKNIKINLQDIDRCTALILASATKSYNVVCELLKQNDIDVNLADNDQGTALIHASSNNSEDIVKELLIPPTV
jgi:ankyrin repeat protein